ncbi:hypothetical protein R6Q57_019393 [Mikania cordata]
MSSIMFTLPRCIRLTRLSHVFPNKRDKNASLVQKGTSGHPNLKARKQNEQDVVKDNLASQESTFEPSRHSSFTAVTEKCQKPVFRPQSFHIGIKRNATIGLTKSKRIPFST